MLLTHKRLRRAIQHLPEHRIFVSLVGGAPVALAKPPAPVEAYNDLGGELYTFFAGLSSNLFEDNQQKVQEAVSSTQDIFTETDCVPDIISWYGYSCGLLPHLLSSINKGKLFSEKLGALKVFSDSPVANAFYRRLSKIDEHLPDMHGRLFRVQIENTSWEKVVDIYDNPDTLFWVDSDRIAVLKLDDQAIQDRLTSTKGRSVFVSLSSGTAEVWQ